MLKLRPFGNAFTGVWGTMDETAVERRRIRARPMIACSMKDLERRSMVHRAAALEKVRVVDVDLTTTLPNLRDHMALVCDLHPQHEHAAEALRSARRLARFCPILIYVPEYPWLPNVMGSAEVRAMVRTQIQKNDRQELERLGKNLRLVLREAAAAIVLHVVEVLNAERLTDARAHYIRELSRWFVEPPGTRRPTVKGLAARLQTTTRDLERKWDGDPLPKPKELLDWLTLLFVKLAPQTTGLTQGAVAASIGLSRQAVYRLGKSLLRHSTVGGVRGPRDDFALALLACAVRHRAQPSPITRELNEACGWLGRAA